MKNINDLSDVIEGLLDVSKDNKFEILFERKDNKTVILVKDEIGDISITIQKTTDLALQEIIEQSSDFLDNQQ